MYLLVWVLLQIFFDSFVIQYIKLLIWLTVKGLFTYFQRWAEPFHCHFCAFVCY